MHVSRFYTFAVELAPLYVAVFCSIFAVPAIRAQAMLFIIIAATANNTVAGSSPLVCRSQALDATRDGTSTAY
jgi:hypothetical protein